MLGEARRAAGDRLAVDVGEVDDVVRVVRGGDCSSAPAPPNATAAICAAARCSSSSRARRTSTRRGASAGGSVEHHPDRQRRRLVVDEAEREQPLDEVRRRARACRPPRCRPCARARAGARGSPRAHPRPRPASSRKRCATFQPGCVAAAHPEHVALGDDPLVGRAERRVGVRVLGELEDRIQHAHDGTRASCATRAVDLQMLDPLDVRPRLGELDRLAVRAPPVDVPLAGVVGGEHEPLAAVLVEQVVRGTTRRSGC